MLVPILPFQRAELEFWPNTGLIHIKLLYHIQVSQQLTAALSPQRQSAQPWRCHSLCCIPHVEPVEIRGGRSPSHITPVLALVYMGDRLVWLEALCLVRLGMKEHKTAHAPGDLILSFAFGRVQKFKTKSPGSQVVIWDACNQF